MLTIHDVLAEFRKSRTEFYKGMQFEKLMKNWLLTDGKYSDIETVWLWNEFPAKSDLGEHDLGIDLVAKTYNGEFWAIQCKCYAENATINKDKVDSFLATSGRTFTDWITHKHVRFALRLWISTTNNWGENAEETIKNQDPPVSRVNLSDLEQSNVSWEHLLENKIKDKARTKKHLMEHQEKAIEAAQNYYKTNTRGKLIMACGTGKTYTSLKLVETLLDGHGLVLFMVPSIALLGQALNDWASDSYKPLKAICICSDARVNKKVKRQSDDDFTDIDSVDLARPASTDEKNIVNQLLEQKNYDGLTVVFSTYQSIDVIAHAQKILLKNTNNEFGKFDFIVCDEAHRTTGAIYTKKDSLNESDFVKIHDDKNVCGRLRMYMTATPRIYGESAKKKASDNNDILFSMDDETVYGKEFYRVNFSYAVQNGILTDYKVLILTVSERELSGPTVEQIHSSTNKSLDYNDTAKLIGVINGLSKITLGDNESVYKADPKIMHRALAFTHKIGNINEPGSSKYIENLLPEVSKWHNENLSTEDVKKTARIECKHVDGSMSAPKRSDILNWLAQPINDENECKVVTNVRCLSEGVDVPALDAVLFLSARNSQVDVVQSVGRVMRSFHKGLADEKKYGYIIIPVVIPIGVSPEDALNDNVTYKVVWDILNALRSHDDHFNAIVNSINLNKDPGEKIIVTNVKPEHKNGKNPPTGGAGIGKNTLTAEQILKNAHENYQNFSQKIYGKLVEKCGDRMYWETWAGSVGNIAKNYETFIQKLVKTTKYKQTFDEFVLNLRQNLNPSISEFDCIEMLAQHLITRPVFESLFKSYKFVKNNSISVSMQRMIDMLRTENLDSDLSELQKFYESVDANIGHIDNLQGKQTIIKTLYEKFFKTAFPKTVEKLGTVYTPIECVDFIIKSVDDLLKAEFKTSLTNSNVHILDPFTGTGTFITRLLQSGLIAKKDLLRKYCNEIHCNEIMLLAYYIADVNIESVFDSLHNSSTYLPFDGICLTDTFQLGESEGDAIKELYFEDNAKAIKKQRKTPIRVIIGNPPYSIGQKSANDNSQNQRYPLLEAKIANTYVKNSTAALSKGLYDSYIKAFRWASDRIKKDEGGIIAFISNGAYIDSNTADGFRKSLANEFDKIYVFNLRGNQRTSGEISRREGGKIFGSGSRTPVAITFLIKKPKSNGSCEIFYKDIGDYLTREQKLEYIKNVESYKNVDYTLIEPNSKGDWINQRDGLFDTLMPLAPQKKFDKDQMSVFIINSCGIATSRDAWAYNYSFNALTYNLKKTIEFYNSEVERFAKAKEKDPSITAADFVNYDSTKFSWDRAQKEKDLPNGVKYSFDKASVNNVIYRPFCKQNGYCNRKLNNCVYQMPNIFPTKEHKNMVICVNGAGSSKPFSCLIVDCIPDLQLQFNNQCFPLYYYEKEQDTPMFKSQNAYVLKSAITDYAEVSFKNYYANKITKEQIFYYTYALLHSKDYRARFSSELKKELPRLYFVPTYNDFLDFVKAGKKLAYLHLNYETFANKCPAKVVITNNNFTVSKMRLINKTSIIYNESVTIENIPAEAFDYIVNGKSAIEWLIERYAITTDKKSLIQNNPNDYAIEQNAPRYILDTLLSVIYVSIETMNIVNALSHLNFNKKNQINMAADNSKKYKA